MNNKRLFWFMLFLGLTNGIFAIISGQWYNIIVMGLCLFRAGQVLGEF